jgi:hypothetical protein
MTLLELFIVIFYGLDGVQKFHHKTTPHAGFVKKKGVVNGDK